MKVQSSCEFCCFRKGLDCDLDLISLYDNMGQVAPLEDRDFQIVDRTCMSRRNQDWVDKQDTDNLKLSLYKELEVRLNYIVIFNSDDFEDLEKTLDSIHAQTMSPLNPSRVIVVLPKDSKVEIGRCIKFLDETLTHSDYFVSSLLDESETKETIVDQVFGRCCNGYYYVLESGAEVRRDMYFSLWYKIYKRAEQVMAVLPKDGISDTCVSATMHKFLKGSSLIDLRSKLTILASEQNVEHMIHDWEEIYESFGN